jgi:hypothetical protein
LKASIGTGKTLCLLVKIFSYCETYAGSTALIVRKEFTDLKDSTMRDFERYFGVKIGSDKDYLLPNGSKIMFRHAAEIEVLKNINLAIAGIEQAEEFETDEQFQFIRDRLRQQNGADVRPLCIIANANGHNWVWKLWINGAKTDVIDEATGQFRYTSGEYECYTANTFANEKNLPPDFVADLRRMETEAPSHYRQYVLNSDEETDQADNLFLYQELKNTIANIYPLREGYGYKIAGFDIARYGDDKCACVILRQNGSLHWETVFVDQWEHKDLNYTTGRILTTSNEQGANKSIIDEDGIGAGPLDTLNKGRGLQNFVGFRNPPLSYDQNKEYGNRRTANAYKLKDLVMKGHIVITDEALIQELCTLKFTYDNHQRKILVSKEKMRQEGIKSPNLADALIMAVSLIGEINYKEEQQFNRQPQYSKECDLLVNAGIR